MIDVDVRKTSIDKSECDAGVAQRMQIEPGGRNLGRICERLRSFDKISTLIH